MSELAQFGVPSTEPACDAGETTVGRACIDFASAVISARRVAVRSHMTVFIVVVLSWFLGGISFVSGGRHGCRNWDVESKSMRVWK